jgi:hypothetical protein
LFAQVRKAFSGEGAASTAICTCASSVVHMNVVTEQLLHGWRWWSMNGISVDVSMPHLGHAIDAADR